MSNRFKVIHNGYEINYFDTIEEVEGYMQSVVEKHSNLSPKKIMDRVIPGSRTCNCNYIRIVRFKYSTLYEEDFIIED